MKRRIKDLMESLNITRSRDTRHMGKKGKCLKMDGGDWEPLVWGFTLCSTNAQS